MAKPSPDTYPAFFKKYVDTVPEEDLPTAFANQLPVITALLNNITEEKSNYAYAPGKWTLKELLQHMIDTERLFNYRALCFARKETVSLPGFDEDAYAANSNANARNWNHMLEEFMAVRRSTELLFTSFSPAMLELSGTSNNNRATVISLGFITIGHVYHHKNIIQERYLS
ncbi:MAG: DinB family protein [Chitinophagaceae bacterium]|nr:DinB family protein [Chitinophagaceae bacterium]